MPDTCSPRFSRSMEDMRPSAVREILKVAVLPDVISFAGGLPAPELFPLEGIRAACERVLSTQGAAALQYGETEGYAPLREYVAGEMERRGVPCTTGQVVITSGSQQVLDLIGRVFLDPGDVVLTETPTYLAALQAFKGCQARFVPVPTDENGIVPEALPDLIARHQPKFLYLISNFQNPTGVTLSEGRRPALAEIAAKHDLVVVEDDPYGRLRYAGKDLPPVKAFDSGGFVVYTSTFSKTVAPGLRTGWIVATPEIIRKLTIIKQAADLHSSSLDQQVVLEYLQSGDTTEHVQRIRQAYGERYGIMDESLGREMPNGFSWTHPEGGMFLWMRCPEHIDTVPLLEKALERKVAFVPGRDFFPDGSRQNYMRLNFSNSTPERIREGVSRLAGLLRR